MSERNESSAVSPSQEYQLERRSKLRVQGPIPARVRGVDDNGKPFDIVASLDDLSAGGLHMLLECRVEDAARLFFIIRIPARPGADATGMIVAARGVARRIEPRRDGSCAVGVEFRRYRQI